MTFDRGAIERHVSAINKLAIASATDGVLVLMRITQLPTWAEAKVNPQRFAIGDADHLIDAIMAHEVSEHTNLYLPWAIFRKDLPAKAKGKESDVVSVLALVADLDSDTGKVGSLPFDAPYVIESSVGNSQQIFPLSRALSAIEAKPLAERLADFVGCDARTKDVSGVWRIPGTLNWPTPNKLKRGRQPGPQQVRVIEDWSGELVEPERFAALPGKSKQYEAAAAVASPDQIFTKLPAGLKKIIAAHPYEGEDQSETAAAAIVGLRRRGLSDGEIKALFTAHVQGVGRRYAEGKDLDADLRRTAEKWATVGREPTDPVDLWGKFAPPSLPEGSLPDVIETFARQQGEVMGADPGGLAMAALAVCAAAIPDKIQLRVKRHDETWLEAARLWIALVGLPSTKKSPIINVAVRPLRRIDGRLARAYSEAKEKYDHLPADDKKHVQPPKNIRVMLGDTTIEAAQEVLKDSPDGVLCFQDELSGWFGQMDKYAGNRGAAKDRAFWLEAFNGGLHTVSRIGRGSIHIENLSVSILGGIQPEPIRRLAAEAHDDGLIQRLLPVVLAPSREGSDEPRDFSVDDYDNLIARLHEMLPPSLGVGAFDMEINLRFDDAAQAFRQKLEREHLEMSQSCEAVNKKLAAHIGKYDGIFARLCVVWHCIENQSLPQIVTEDTAQRARAFLHKFILPNAISFYSDVLGLSDQHDALTAVAGYILAHKLDEVTNRDVQRGGRLMRGLERRDTERIFEQLDAFGWVARTPGPRPSDPPHWIVNPAVHAKFAVRAEQERQRRERDRDIVAGIFGAKQSAA